jgi:hypothetical protein
MSATFLLGAVLVAQAVQSDAQPQRLFDSVVADYETGPLFIFQNDGRYGANGTAYSARDVGQQRNLVVSQRLSAEAQRGRHTLIALWAPLDLTTRVTLATDLTFQGTTFAGGAIVDHRYLFDGYRLSYLYRLAPGPRFSFHLGASVQVRNASVEFRSVEGSAPTFKVERDIGLVFALKARAKLDAGVVYGQVDADVINTFGLGVPGGLHDVALTLGIPLTRAVDLFLRLRIVGGGARVPRRDFFNWGNFGAALVGLRVDLPRLWP